MFELSQEKLIMNSDDMSVELTTHRIIQQNQKQKNDIMLEDYESYEIRSAHIGNYKLLTIIFAITTILLLIMRLDEYFKDPGRRFVDSLVSYALILSAIYLTISIHFYRISRRYLIRIIGKFNNIEFRVVNPKKKSVQRFLNAMISQSKLFKNHSIDNK